jgi:RIO-like serine/threonine protein kinase
MKFDVNILRYIEKDAWRVLVSVEMGMKNHELVPVELVNAISGRAVGTRAVDTFRFALFRREPTTHSTEDTQ